MSDSTYKKLAALTEMLFQVEQSKMKHIIAREAELRRDISRVDEARQANLALPIADLTAIRHVGADVQWQAWLGQRRAELNRHLALCLAQKEHMLKILRRSHGRKVATNQLVSNDEREAARQRAKADLERNSALVMFQHYRETTRRKS